ncbi:folylpolyglutamate synthase/dihydrofolate synthase family protein [uncultured Sphingomonas sp.]|uniref:bifunctional folylpolyglutamate synthase/dihydrofolate synthase n=1 Tax=uncultured Sphingomonas sp. TaxID=158754 RepID=UPI00262A59CD|nr:folylpolyglutamate synthase/dihydrofolate synthase family protein [uncultured Sphingomonas sp.]
MPDHARSTDPAVQEQLDRLWSLSPGADILGLDRITRLLARLGDPHHHMPPVFHVAGTNGKGSTCAFLRSAIEAAGYSVHVYASPHLVRFNERIRLAGRLIEDEALAPLLAEVLDHADGIGASFFEVTTAAAFLAFARTPAAATIVEVGLGGRLDATNVVPAPAVCGIAALGLDHQTFLGDSIEQIAAEKAGIAKANVPLVTMDYPAPIRRIVADVAASVGAPVFARRRGWTSQSARTTVRYIEPGFSLVANRPRLAGPHQSRNYALALAMLRHQGALNIPEAAMRAAADWAHWPARMQRLAHGPLTARLPLGSACWLDGAHNPSAALPVARALHQRREGHPTALVIGMLANKDAGPVLATLGAEVQHVVAVPVPDHAHHAPTDLVAQAQMLGLSAEAAPDPGIALDRIAVHFGTPVTTLIAGSLYLAGEVLEANDQLPD